MESAIKWFFRKRLYFIPLTLVFFFVAYNETLFFSPQKELDKAVKIIESRLSAIDIQIEQTLTSPAVENKLLNGLLNINDNKRLSDLPFSVLVYKKDSLVYWNNNMVIPQVQLDTLLKGYRFFQSHSGSYYIIWKKNIEDSSKLRSVSHSNYLVCLIPVKYEYATENDYLQSKFDPAFRLPDYFNLTFNAEQGARTIKSPEGKVIFYISFNPAQRSSEVSYWLVGFFFAGFIFLLLSFNALLKLLPARKYEWLKILLPFALLLGLYYLVSLQNVLPQSVRNWRIFDPDILASPYVALSLGNMLLQCLFLLWVSLWFYYQVNFRRIKITNLWLKLIFQLAIFSMLFFIGIYFVYAIKGLVEDSKISFSFYNPFNPDNVSLIAMVTISMLLFSFFIIALKLLSEFYFFLINEIYWWGCFICACLLAAFYFFLFDIDAGRWLIIGTIALFIFLISFFRVKNIIEIGFVRLFILLILFSSGAAVLIQYYGNRKELNNRIAYAKKYLNERDNVTEYLLADTRDKILDDKFIQNYFINPHISSKEFKDRLQKLYFKTGFNRYQLKLIPYNDSGSPLRTDNQPDYGSFGSKLLKDAEETEIEGLYYIASKTGNLSYINVYPIVHEDKSVGKLIVVLTSRVYKEVNVYPELLLLEKNKIPEAIYNYSFAIYTKNRLTDEGGDYSYSYLNRYDVDNLASNEPYYVNEKPYSHLLLKAPSGRLIIVTNKEQILSSFLSYFSYIFIVLFVLVVFILLGIVMDRQFSVQRASLLERTSFRNIIQFSFIMVIFAAVIIIGFITGQFFISQFSKYAKDNLVEKMKVVDGSVRYTLEHEVISDSLPGLEQKDAAVILSNNISNLSDVQDIDVNFYDLQGNLITSSQPAIFEKGLISRKINSTALYKLAVNRQTLIVQQEKIGNLSYLSGYQPIHNTRGELIAFLNIPYFNTTRNLNEQIGFFFASLVNILVFALIVAGFLAPFISNQITRKLSFIAEKFKLVNLSSQNELIKWNSKDELGTLVAEFNKMVVKLDESAQRLARSERESAWREMAKQVAHEIKNPLTPMKLSIQHLQRAYAQNDPRAKELAEKMSATLIEQIENLSKIATEFSSFAKMPRPENEILGIHSVIGNSVDLYKNEANVTINYKPDAINDRVNGDRNQLIRVFNNLILNAVQAIPEQREGEIEIATTNDDAFIVISIKDNGSGIDEETAEKLFTPSFTTKSSGTGLGLAITKNIIEMTGGTVWFKSESGEGTTFYVKLPVI